MSVRVRRQYDIPTPTISEDGHDEEDFLQDPAQRWDDLPQPFRFLNKLVTSVFEEAWEIANSREVERITAASKIRPSQLTCSTFIKEFGNIPQEFGNVGSICSPPDGRYVVLGLNDGLAVLDAETQEPQASWCLEDVAIHSLSCCHYDAGVYTICAIDDMGCGRLFVFTSGAIFQVQAVNEWRSVSFSSIKSAAVKLMPTNFMDPGKETSSEFSWRTKISDPITKEFWVEILKAPRDAWNKELEAALAVAESLKQKTSETKTVSSHEQDVQDRSVEVPVASNGNLKQSTSAVDSEKYLGEGVNKQSKNSSQETDSGVEAKDKDLGKESPPKSNQHSWPDVENFEKDSTSDSRSISVEQVAKDGKSSKSGETKETTDKSISESKSKKQSKPRSETEKPKGSQNKKTSKVSNAAREYKFTPAVVALKIKPPSPLQGTTWSSALQLSRTVDSGSVMGTGQNHLLSTQHLENRFNVFKSLHKDLVPQLSAGEGEKPAFREATFEFLTPGRMIHGGLNSQKTAEETNSVMIWWSRHNQVQHYALVKPLRDATAPSRTLQSASGKRSRNALHTKNSQFEDAESRPEVVWSSTSCVVATAVSWCTSLVAVAVETGVVTIWDKYLGMKRRTVHVGGDRRIVQLEFLNPSICPQEESALPYTTSTCSYVLARCKDGSTFLINCGVNNDDAPSDVSLSFDGLNDEYSAFSLIPGIPELAVTCRKNGRVYIHDIVTTDVVCQVTLPGSHETLNPWQPVLTTAGQVLYVSGKPRSNAPNSNSSPRGAGAGVFVFRAEECPALKRYQGAAEAGKRLSLPHSVHCTAEQRVDALFKHRLEHQAERKERMQERWPQLKDELKLIQQRKNLSTPRTNVMATG